MSCGLSWYLSSSTRHSSKILCIFSTLSKHLSSSSFFYWRGDPYLHSWRAHLCPLSFWVDCFLLTLIIVHGSIKIYPKGSPALQSNLPYFLYGEAIQFPPAVWVIHPSNTFSFLPSFLPLSLSSPFLKISLNVWMFCLVCMSMYNMCTFEEFELSIKIPGTWVTDCFQPPFGRSEPNPGLLEEQQVLLCTTSLF